LVAGRPLIGQRPEAELSADEDASTGLPQAAAKEEVFQLLAKWSKKKKSALSANCT